MERAEEQYAGERQELAEARAVEAAAREDWERSVAQAKKELEEWEASKLATQKKWTKWMKAQAEAGRNPTPEALEAASAAQREYQEAQAVAEKEVARILPAVCLRPNHWTSMAVQGRGL